VILEFTKKYWFLSNFYPVKIYYDGIFYPTVSHAYHAQKLLDVYNKKIISQVPEETLIVDFIDNNFRDWEKDPLFKFKKFEIMNSLLRIKFSNPILLARLLKTGYENLIYGNHFHMNFWGSCLCGRCNNSGENHLGKILMLIREEAEIKGGYNYVNSLLGYGKYY
jgi:ribA/ribD-fused uncharacterized protein